VEFVRLGGLGQAGKGVKDNSGKPINIIPSGLFDPLAVSLIKLWPDQNLSGNGAFNYLTEPKVRENQDNFDIRFDHTFSEKDSAFTRYSYQVQPSTHQIPSKSKLFEPAK